MTWGIGLIGATGIAERAVLGPSRTHGDLAVRAVAASDGDRALRFGRRHGLRVLGGYEDVVTARDVDIVYVSLHNSAHARWARLAVLEGKTVLVEKPLCLSVAECEALAEAERRGGGRVLEALPTLGHPWHDVVRTAIGTGRYGELRGVRSRFVFRPPAAGGYRTRRDLGGGVFLDAASYWLQALQETVTLPSSGGGGVARCAGPDHVDHAFDAELPSAGGAPATVSCSLGPRPAAEHTYEFAEARVRVRGVLLPTAGAVPLNVAVRTSAGRTEVTRTDAVAYYPRQLARLGALMSGAGGDWGAGLAAARPRIAAMERIHRSARRQTVPVTSSVPATTFDKEHL